MVEHVLDKPGDNFHISMQQGSDFHVHVCCVDHDLLKSKDVCQTLPQNTEKERRKELSGARLCNTAELLLLQNYVVNSQITYTMREILLYILCI